MILTQKSTKILGIVAAVLAFFIGIMLVVVPFFGQLSENNAAISAAEDEVAMMQSQRDGFLQSKTNYSKIKQVDEDLRTQFPELADQNGIIAELSEGISASGLNRNELKLTFESPAVSTPDFTAAPPAGEGEGEAAPAPEGGAGAGVGEMATLKFSFSLTGGAESIERFLAFMNETQRAIVLEGYSIDRGKTGGGYILSGTANAYIFAKIADPENLEEAPQEEETVVTEEVPAE